MHVPTVRFTESNPDAAPSPRREERQNILRLAIEACRPAGESWTVVTRVNADATLLTFDLARDTEATRSLTYMPESDDAEYSQLFGTVCQFLRFYWLGAVNPS